MASSWGFASILLIVVPAQGLPAPGAAIWLIVTLAVPVSVATNIMVIAYLRPPRTSTVSLVCGLLLSAAAITFVVMLVWGGVYGFWNVAGPGMWAMSWAAGVQIVAFVAGLEAIRLAGPVYVSQMNYVTVGAGFLWALVLFNEGLRRVGVGRPPHHAGRSRPHQPGRGAGRAILTPPPQLGASQSVHDCSQCRALASCARRASLRRGSALGWPPSSFSGRARSGRDAPAYRSRTEGYRARRDGAGAGAGGHRPHGRRGRGDAGPARADGC